MAFSVSGKFSGGNGRREKKPNQKPGSRGPGLPRTRRCDPAAGAFRIRHPKLSGRPVEQLRNCRLRCQPRGEAPAEERWQPRGPRPETGPPHPARAATTRKDPLATSVGEKGTGPIAPPAGFARVPWKCSDVAAETTGEQLRGAINRGPAPASDGDASSGVFPALQRPPPPPLVQG